MRIVVALGGNAILRRGEPMTVANQRASIAAACGPLAELAAENDLVVSHGNGPQVGLLALQAAAYDEVSSYPFDVLGAQTEGMIGYLIEQELGNQLGNDRAVATVLTRTEVLADDPAFEHPTKFVGPVYDRARAFQLADERGWTVKADGQYFRRVVPSPAPQRILHLQPIEWLLAQRCVVICAGGGGIPTTRDPLTGQVSGVEAVIDKDLASGVLARDIGADTLIIATDVPGVFVDFGSPTQRLITSAHPDALDALDFAAGSIGPKVAAASAFAREAYGDAYIGALNDFTNMVHGKSGTRVSRSVVGIEFA
ncbi:MAG: carbamate kinase [Kineosporiaceae bacterium]|nr:carbamate kinase [Aeromicrobium sp.]